MYYTEIRVRKYSSDFDSNVWEQHPIDQMMTVIKSNGTWKFEFEKESPFSLNVGDVVFLPKLKYNRVIKGDGILVISLKEL